MPPRGIRGDTPTDRDRTLGTEPGALARVNLYPLRHTLDKVHSRTKGRREQRADIFIVVF